MVNNWDESEDDNVLFINDDHASNKHLLFYSDLIDIDSLPIEFNDEGECFHIPQNVHLSINIQQNAFPTPMSYITNFAQLFC